MHVTSNLKFHVMTVLLTLQQLVLYTVFSSGKLKGDLIN